MKLVIGFPQVFFSILALVISVTSASPIQTVGSVPGGLVGSFGFTRGNPIVVCNLLCLNGFHRSTANGVCECVPDQSPVCNKRCRAGFHRELVLGVCKCVKDVIPRVDPLPPPRPGPPPPVSPPAPVDPLPPPSPIPPVPVLTPE